MKRSTVLSLVAGVACLFAGIAAANNYSPRQYYGSWSYHPTKHYHYRPYYYKPTPTYTGYKHHYVIYQPAQPRYYYYYNPYRKTYWGRCPVDHGGKEAYSHLAPEHQKGDLKDIPETAFPAPGALPPIPESDATANVKLDLPPDDLPAASPAPKAGIAVPQPPG